VLEIASGSGKHIAYFAKHFPKAIWQPSEHNPRYLHSIVGYVDHYKYDNLRVPLFIDITKPPNNWALPADYRPKDVDVLLNINMIHISSSAAVEGLFSAAGSLLKPKEGKLITYGPYVIDGIISAQSNIDFDVSLRSQNPEWYLRDVHDLKLKAQTSGLKLIKIYQVPDNNHMLIFQKD
uniref:Methyltransferase-like 26 n=1 Tax=Acrobeloides nanus TaxID=290746 RepID=A0A914EF36_9BILA